MESNEGADSGNADAIRENQILGIPSKKGHFNWPPLGQLRPVRPLFQMARESNEGADSGDANVISENQIQGRNTKKIILKTVVTEKSSTETKSSCDNNWRRHNGEVYSGDANAIRDNQILGTTTKMIKILKHDVTEKSSTKPPICDNNSHRRNEGADSGDVTAIRENQIMGKPTKITKILKPDFREKSKIQTTCCDNYSQRLIGNTPLKSESDPFDLSKDLNSARILAELREDFKYMKDEFRQIKENFSIELQNVKFSVDFLQKMCEEKYKIPQLRNVEEENKILKARLTTMIEDRAKTELETERKNNEAKLNEVGLQLEISALQNKVKELEIAAERNANKNNYSSRQVTMCAEKQSKSILSLLLMHCFIGLSNEKTTLKIY